MIKFKNILTIIKKEIKALFDNPTAYIILVIFLGLWEIIFFLNVFLTKTASLRIMFDFLPWLLVVLVPALTVSTFSKEKSQGTIEWILTNPIQELELVIAKFFSSLSFSTIIFAFTLPIAISFSNYAKFDWGIYVAQMIAAILLTSILISIGLFLSSLIKQQIASLLATIAVLFILVVLGLDFFASFLPLGFSGLIQNLSVVSHYSNMVKGVLDLRDVWFFLSGTTVFIALTYLNLIKFKFGNNKKSYHSLQFNIYLIIGITILTNILSKRIPGRLDLTRHKSYTLSQATRKTLNDLDDIVSITLYQSEKLPNDLQPTIRETQDILNDYEVASNGKIRVDVRHVNDEDAQQKARMAGIRQIQFNMVGSNEFQVKNGYLGLTVNYADEKEVIPFIQNITDLEYQLTSFIRKLTIPDEDKKTIAFLAGNGEKSLNQDYSSLNDELKKLYKIRTITDSNAPDSPETENNPLAQEPSPTPTPSDQEPKQVIPDDIDLLVVAGPDTKIGTATQEQINTYLRNGGKAIFLIDKINIDLDTQQINLNANSGAYLLSPLGVNVENKLVYDLNSNLMLSLPSAFGYIRVPYPLWIKAKFKAGTTFYSDTAQNLAFPWVHPITLNEDTLNQNNYIAEKVIITSSAAGTQEENYNLDPHGNFSKEDLKTRNLAVLLKKKENTNADGDQTNLGETTNQILVVGDSDFLADDFIQNSPSNLSFMMDAFATLTNATSLADLKNKQIANVQFEFTNDAQANNIRNFNVAISIILPVGFGFYRLIKRKQLQNKKYI